MKAVIANDHGAVELSRRIKSHLESRNIEVNWLGITTEDSCDYPDQAKKAVDEFRKGGYDFGVLCCGTGIGISISANKLDGIRCALPQNCFAAALAREHNDANFIAFGGRIAYQDKVEDMLDAYLDASFQGGRHARRVAKIMDLEQ